VKFFTRFILVILFATPLGVSAGIDQNQRALSEQSDRALRWDNISAEPVWIDGISPETNSDWGMDSVHLDATSHITLRLPISSELRLFNPDDGLKEESLEISLSDGSGLWIEHKPLRAIDGKSLLIRSHYNKPLLARISTTASRSNSIDFAVFLARREDVTPHLNYTYPLPLGESAVSLRRSKDIVGEQYWRLDAYSQNSIEIQGPVSIQLNSHLIYPGTEQRLIQDYRIQVKLDGWHDKWIESSTSAETSFSIWVDGQPTVLGHRQIDYFDVPDGKHQVSISADRPLLVRPVQLAKSDFLLPDLNQSNLTLVNDNRDFAGQWGLSIWSLNDKELKQISQKPDLALVDRLFVAERMVRDNSFRNGGLVGSSYLLHSALTQFEAQEVQKQAHRLAGFRTSYRNLLPLKKLQNRSHETAYFIPRQLRALGQSEQLATISEQHLEEWLSRSVLGHFDTLPNRKSDDVLIYRLPPRTASTELRIAVDKNFQQDQGIFWLQMDNFKPLRIRITNADKNAIYELKTNPADAALDQLMKRHNLTGQPTLSGAFAALRKPAPLISAGTFELFVPAATREIRVWQDVNAKTPVRVALQYRAGKTFSVGESSYSGLLEQIGRQTAYQYFYAALIGKGEDNNMGQRVLENLWLPLIRRLRARSLRYNASIATYQLPSRKTFNNDGLQEQKISALWEERKGNWIGALRIWAGIVESSIGKDKETAQLRVAACLSNSGEVYLADRLWRYLSLSEYSEISKAAADKLRFNYEKSGNTEAAGMLAAAMFIHRPSKQTLTELVNRHIADGKYQEALLIGLLLPQSERDPEQLLLASYRLGWWQVFKQNLSKVSEQKRYFWTGLLDQRRGNYSSARINWTKAGQSGLSWLETLDRGLNLRVNKAKLVEANENNKKIIDDWLAWNQPGSYEWSNSTFSVQDYAKGETLHNIELDIFERAVRATRKRPVSFKVIGPGRIKIKVRPLHRSADTQPFNGWIRFKINGRKKFIPISGNAPVNNIVLLDDALKPGQTVNYEHNLSPGLNEISVDGYSTPLVVQWYTSQARLPLSVFPRASLDSLRMAPLEPSASDAESKQYSVLETVNGRSRLTNHLLLNPDQRPTKQIGSEYMSSLPQETNQDIFELIYKQDWNGVLKLDSNQTEEAALSQITAITWLVENYPKQEKDAWLVGEEIARTFPGSSEIQTLWKRISRRSEWVIVTEVAEGPGLEFKKIQGWQPESPYLKKRQALLGQISKDEHVVSGASQLVLAFMNTQPSKIRLDLMQRMPDFLPPQSMTVLYRLDEGIERRIVLNSKARSKQVTVAIPTGEHQLRLSLLQPTAQNQFLGVRIKDSARGPTGLVKDYERSYYKTRVGDPLRAHVMGPAWLRIDERFGGVVSTRYQKVGRGWHVATIKPTAGQKESLVRLFTRRTSNRPQNVSRIEAQTPNVAQTTIINVSDAATADEIRIDDVFELGAQEDGTLGVRTALVRRNNVDEDNGGTQPEQFVQLDAAYYFKPEYRDFYSESSFLARYRERGNPSLGLKQRLDFISDSWLPNFKLQGDFYLQVPDKQVETSGLLRGAVSKKIPVTPSTSLHPSLSAFVRYLSISNAEWARLGPQARRRVDQDIFTQYKGDHKFGQTLSLALKHNPWLDTLWLVQGAVVSNEDLNLIEPDHTSVKVGWRQLLGPVVANLSYRRKFFYIDSDRRRAAQRSLANFTLDWDHWLNEKNLIRFGMQYSRDIERSADLGYFSVSWFPSEGRGYRDFRPGTPNFRQLLKSRIPRQPNNILEDVGT